MGDRAETRAKEHHECEHFPHASHAPWPITHQSLFLASLFLSFDSPARPLGKPFAIVGIPFSLPDVEMRVPFPVRIVGADSLEGHLSCGLRDLFRRQPRNNDVNGPASRVKALRGVRTWSRAACHKDRSVAKEPVEPVEFLHHLRIGGHNP